MSCLAVQAEAKVHCGLVLNIVICKCKLIIIKLFAIKDKYQLVLNPMMLLPLRVFTEISI